MTINKCMMHKLGFTLSDLALNGLDMNNDRPLGISAHNSCRVDSTINREQITFSRFMVHPTVEWKKKSPTVKSHIKTPFSKGSKGSNNGVITRKR